MADCTFTHPQDVHRKSKGHVVKGLAKELSAGSELGLGSISMSLWELGEQELRRIWGKHHLATPRKPFLV